MAITAVIFDVGGVVLSSALPILREFERSHGLPSEFISSVVGRALTRANGPQQRLEKGEILLDEFCRVFDEEFAGQGHQLSTAEIMLEVSRTMEVQPIVFDAVRRLREAGFKTAALTNAWTNGEPEMERTATVRAGFDVYLASCEEGLRKPDPAFLKLACERLAAKPSEVAYLDENGLNLKPARKLGMTTIKVRDASVALVALEQLVEISLFEDGGKRGDEKVDEDG